MKNQILIGVLCLAGLLSAAALLQRGDSNDAIRPEDWPAGAASRPARGGNEADQQRLRSLGYLN